MYSCNATDRHRSRLHICDLTLGHDDDHVAGDHSWPQEKPRAAGERAITA